MPEYFFIEQSSADEADAISAGLRWLAQRAVDDDASEAILYLRAKQDLGPGSVLNRALGTDLAKRMRGGQDIAIGCARGLILTPGAAKQSMSSNTRGPALCVFCDSAEIGALSAFSQLTAICVVPVADYNEDWIIQHSASGIAYESVRRPLSR